MIIGVYYGYIRPVLSHIHFNSVVSVTEYDIKYLCTVSYPSFCIIIKNQMRGDFFYD